MVQLQVEHVSRQDIQSSSSHPKKGPDGRRCAWEKEKVHDRHQQGRVDLLVYY